MAHTSVVATCLLSFCLFFAASLPAAPRLLHSGVSDLGGGEYRHDYVLSFLDDAGRIGPVINVEDFHATGSPLMVSNFWLNVTGPDGWDAEIVGDAGHWRLVDGASAVTVGAEIAGFSITASVPTVVQSPIEWTYDRTDDSAVNYISSASLPGSLAIPVPGTALLLLTGSLGIARARWH